MTFTMMYYKILVCTQDMYAHTR